MAKIIGLAGSLRSGSFNSALLRAAAEVAPKSLEVQIASIAGIPLYDADLESEKGLPETVTALKELVAAADGFLIVTPEYNSSMPGVLKNAIDWLSRPAKDISRVFGDKPVGLFGAAQVFDAQGVLVDEKIKKLLTELMVGFSAFVDE